MAAPDMAAPAAGHRRNRSAVLKSIIVSSKGHKRSPTEGAPLQHQPVASSPPYLPATDFHPPLLPPDHPHSHLRRAGQNESNPTSPPSPRKSQDPRSSSPKKSLHKKSLSSVSLRSLAKREEKSRDKKPTDSRPSQEGAETAEKPKRPKSSSNLAAMFGKARRDRSPTKETRDKENTEPPRTSHAPPPTPIWAEFSSQPEATATATAKAPLNEQRRSIEDEIARYTPRDYSPSKQRNFFEYGQPALRPAPKERPKSMFAPNSSTTSLLETFSRKRSNERMPLSDTQGNEGRFKDASPTKSKPARPVLSRASTDNSKDFSVKPMAPPPSPKKPNRVMAAVAAFNGKSKQVDGAAAAAAAAAAPYVKPDPKVVDAEFEEVLESRNIPTHQRAQMRTLKLQVKADFVRMHKLDTPQTARATSGHSSVGDAPKPVPQKSSKSRHGSPVHDAENDAQEDKSANSTKRERPRSRTFTFNRNDSPTKKQKGDLGERKTSAKQTAIPKTPSMRSLRSNASDRSVSNGAKSVKADEFIAYLKKTPKPQNVEVGKLHKLRLLIRNETVDWVDNFIQDGGMTELVGLLHRIMEIEWREDHEDTLLHELLRCLKGLCTTATALKQLREISPTLYPALLAMLFDEEHKGPSEFTTRELIIDIIFAHISMAPEAELGTRATELMKYLKDPVKEKETSTVPFILQMHQPRPYQVWCKELSNVTKEVFWIFIHHLNVVPIPPKSTDGRSYAKAHFPGQRAIVPAAPYVGGVEWDATNYLATHIDLLNGIMASIPTRTARNEFRQELKVSGFEKLMGHLRACNPKYYGAVHDSVKVWVGAALEDDWDVKTVRMGVSDSKGTVSPLKQSPKKNNEAPPQLQLQAPPKMDISLGLGLGFEKEIAIGNPSKVDDDWI
ncbi:gtpase binding protein rid1 [Stemphylium lycopersici]|uniref:Gtpase binding protein rid1 n=1 Tax=Stemphylium lycopersici TaxID=183478 RepID=A0A364NH42_STELY|nr:gtpase binding protein rid1 [Stemphylium lycopersici]RAR16599.1 gtpase binding protein rid1 [Stemphylium lycopersici]